MGKDLGAAFAALAAFAPAAHAEEYFMWGVETWECGQSEYVVQVGQGADVRLLRIVGDASASVLPGADVNGTLVRQSLASAVPGARADLPPVVIIKSPPHQRWNQAVDSNVVEVNIKQTGSSVVHIPIDQVLPGVVAPGGVMRIVIDTRTYDGFTLVTDRPTECLNTELHLMVVYERR